MKVSVVTICYNERETIVRTLESVRSQTYQNIEYIVIDGGSTDGTAQILRENSARLAFFSSEKDRGIYDGMNKGLARCTGDYVLFCNAGDCLAANDIIEKMVAKAEADGEPDLVYGDAASEVNGELMVRTAHGPSFMSVGMPACHEAMMYKLSLIRQLGLQYDLSYRIAADYKFTYQFVRAAKTFSYVPSSVVVFAEGGVSTANKWKGLSEACRARREVGGLSMGKRLFIRAAQIAALLLSTYAGPLYRAIRLRRS